jgi:isopentenyldiphosphate isomerase
MDNPPAFSFGDITLLLGVILLVVMVTGSVLRAYRRSRASAALRPPVAAGTEAAIPQPWLDLRREVAAGRDGLNQKLYEQIQRLFVDGYADGKESPESVSGEYGKDEFLLVVNEEGNPAALPHSVLSEFARTASKYPAYLRWFREDVPNGGEHPGERVLLAARWLCHLTGLRHRTIELLLDPPGLEGHTLIQVRSLTKVDSPGDFDVPCAGHVTGVDETSLALEKELREELNLSLSDLEDLRVVGTYNAFARADRPGFTNNELRVLYKAGLKPGSAGKIRFSDGEVAALCVFSLPELKALVSRYPERVASGLYEALGAY